MAVDPRTPVVVGVGQFTERIDDPGYRGMSSVDLATEAVRAALADTGADVTTVAEAVEVFAGLRQFEICTPFSKPPFGCSDNYVRSVANRVGADPARALLEPIGGNGPQKLMTEFAGAIAAGDIEVALILGSEPGSTAKYFAGRDNKPDFTEHVGGQLEDRGYGFEQYMSEYTAKHGLTGAPVQYGLLDNARRGRLGLTVADYRHAMAELFAPFSKVAAKNPFSSSPVERSVEEIETVTDENRMICDPYPRLLVARDTVNQGAAALVMSVSAARRLGVPEEKWVYLRGHADQTEQDLLDRVDLHVSYSAKQAVAEALRVAEHRHRRCGDVRPLQLLPVPGLRGVRRFRADRRRPAGVDAHRRPALFRRPRQQLFAARYRGDRDRCARQRGFVWARRRQRRCDEQVFGGGVLHKTWRVGGRP